MQQQFAERVKDIVRTDASVTGLAVAGSWLTGEIDAFSDLDLILVTKEKVSDSREKMLRYARQYGKLLTGFTGEHVGEPRVLICLYDDPLLHVDIKFVTVEEFAANRIETPVILYDTDNALQKAIESSVARFPYPDHQWIEDRFWIWIHYALLKIGRGEYFEAMDFIAYLRMMVLGPLLHIRNGHLPRGVRKVETQLPPADLKALKLTVAGPDAASLIAALQAAVLLYRDLRVALFHPSIQRQQATEEKVMQYFQELTQRTL